MEGFKVPQGLTACSDTELAQLVKAGSQPAFEEIARRYKGLIGYFAKQYSATGTEPADFMQEGLLALHSACKTYDESKKASFRNYAGVCINNRFMSLIRSLRTKSTIPRESIVSFEDIDPSDRNLGNPENLILEQESSKNLIALIQDKLSPLEIKVLKSYLQGLSYVQIADNLAVSAKAVDNAMQRIRRKIAGILETL
ncbi:MAG: sigma-70 family RNA polymerase sigma factor [Ruminococcus sp.]|nr:sigma-70 family RNA polymerase sigma factor [Ruminococcus sp.]